MIKIENISVYNIARAVFSARNALNSWDKSDSDLEHDILGEKDLDLAKRLYKAGAEHRKFMRQIFVTMDITAPLYWISELDTYKIGTARNSCSFMHKGVSKPFEITDFSIHDERVYEILTPTQRKRYELKYPYETDEYLVYVGENGRKYKVFRNGRVVACEFEYTDTMDRHRVFEEKECKPSVTKYGYYEINLGGRTGSKWLLHRLVASVWLENSDNLKTVNHIDGDKGNNSVENLEWCELTENIKKGYEAGLFENCNSIRVNYIKWKNNIRLVEPIERVQLEFDYRYKHASVNDIANKYGLTSQQVRNMIDCMKGHDELFALCYTWEKIIETLNKLRDDYLETKDDEIFQVIRCLLPSGYNQKFTITMNYENVVNIIHQRSNHRLDEWRLLVAELKKLPYITEIMGD